MADVFEQIDRVNQQARAELAAVNSAAELEQFRIKYLGSNGQLKDLMKLLGQAPKEQKPAVGQRVNAVKTDLTAAFEERKSNLGGAVASGILEDVTEPGRQPQIGNTHIIMKVIDELTELVKGFGAKGLAYIAVEASGEHRSTFA